MPFPEQSGQALRVRNTLLAARARFHVTFASVAPEREHAAVRRELRELSDEVRLLPSRIRRSAVHRLFYHALGFLCALATGLRVSNFLLGRVEFTPRRVHRLAGEEAFDLVLFEYWHTWRCTRMFRARATPTLLDSHNVLWQVIRRNRRAWRWAPAWLRDWSVRAYRKREEKAWAAYDGIIAINRSEHAHIRAATPERVRVFFSPMGVDLARWPFSWSAPATPKIAYYGGLGSRHNQQAARLCHEEIMPAVWSNYPSAEFWLVGSHPPASLRALAADPRVHVTGFVAGVADLLASMSVILCPWTGTYGFRSRVIEILALGVPFVASPDAVDGMGLLGGSDLLLAGDLDEMADHTLRLLGNPEEAARLSRSGRRRVEEHYDIEKTYGRLVGSLAAWLQSEGPGP